MEKLTNKEFVSAYLFNSPSSGRIMSNFMEILKESKKEIAIGTNVFYCKNGQYWMVDSNGVHEFVWNGVYVKWLS